MFTIITFLLACVALAGDVYSTARDLDNGGHETNPVMRWIMSKIGVWPGLLSTHIGFAVLIWFADSWWINLGTIAAFGYATYHNLRDTSK